jgi:DNA-binding LytR/AlgR family response regulator
MVLMLLGYAWGAFVASFFFRGGSRWTGNIWIDGLIASVVMSVPFTLVVWLTSRVAFGADMPPSALPFLFGSVWMVSIVLTIINILLAQPRITHAAPAPPKFLERLPLKLRGAEVWAVEAEDHYLRLHTSKGQDLILMRLADAVAELEGIEGAQVHRSWWVARDAITDARRGDGRATLTLRDGAEVPVSRTYAGTLRERGWI